MNRKQFLNLGVSGLAGFAIGAGAVSLSIWQKSDNPKITFKPYFYVDVYPRTRSLTEDLEAIANDRVGHIEFCYKEPKLSLVDVFLQEDSDGNLVDRLVAEKVRESSNYQRLIFRETKKLDFKFVVRHRKREHVIQFPVDFLNNEQLSCYFLDPKVSDNNPDIEFLPNSEGSVPEDCIVTYRDRQGRYEVKYKVHGITDVAEVSKERFQHYWDRRRDMFDSFDTFLRALKN